ncbi:MAG TPA: gliding motility lipoprotein GldB [Mucilaginibacter sp.]|nr:gliding motility lipoprotein GldB [Mucilaginibacter sp.]
MSLSPAKATQIYLIFLTSILLTACHHSNQVDVSNIDVHVTIERFDHDLDKMRTGPMAPQAAYMTKKYGAFYRDFMERILPAGSTRDTGYFMTLRRVLHTKDYLALKHAVDSVYPNMDKTAENLTEAFKYIKYYYPKKKLPKVYAYFSGFAAQTSVGNGYVAIGLDMFLGADSKFYPALIESIPHYLSRHFTPSNITPRVVEGMAREDMFPESDSDKTMLSKMIYRGKVLYFMDRVLPDVPDSVKIGYTPEQLKWCEDFKPQIWGYFLEQNLLYETDDEKTQKFLGEAPFTPGLGEKNESAPKLAVWTGWQIVREYMDKHPEVTLEQLMADKSAQHILNGSRYRPK